MKSLSAFSGEVAKAFTSRSRRMRGASFFVKAVMIGLGSAFVSLAQFLSLQPNETPTHWHYIGMVGSFVVLIGVLFMILTEDDPTEELLLARNAIETARETDALRSEFAKFEAASARATELYSAYDRMRGVLERTALGGFQTEIEVIDYLMTAASRHLSIAMGFDRSDQWTLCVYRAEATAEGTELVCRAHDRAIRCSIEQARRWPIGVGVGGIAFANRSEIIVPDMQAEGIGTMYAVPGHTLPYDDDRYRSIVVVPVMVGKNPEPWGVVIGTSSVPYHFNLEEHVGMEPAEGARTLAGMVALVVALCSGAEQASGGGSGRNPNKKPVSTDT